MNLLIHTHRCQKLDVEVSQDINIPALKAKVEETVGEGKLFRITGRNGNPGVDEEYKLVFHGQVLEDYDAIASSNLPRLESLRKKLPEKQKQAVALEADRKELQKEVQESSQQQGPLTAMRVAGVTPTTAGAVVTEELKKQLEELKKKEAEAKKEHKAIEDLVKNLEKKCAVQKLSVYYTGGASAMLHIVSAKVKAGQYKIRLNYLGHTVESTHGRCERVSAVLEKLRKQHERQLPHTSDDFKISDALFWRCAATRMVRLSPDKCLCEYGIPDGSTFEHEIEKVPVSKQAKSNFSSLQAKSSKIQNGTPAPAPGMGSRRSKSSVGALRPTRTVERSTNAARRSSSSTSGASSRPTSACSSSDGQTSPSAWTLNSARSAESTSASSTMSASTGALPPLRQCSASSSDCGCYNEKPMGNKTRFCASFGASIEAPSTDFFGAATYGPSRQLADPSPDEVARLKEKAELAQKELRRAQKIAAKAEKALKQSEMKRRFAEAEAARAHADARAGLVDYNPAEIETARQAQRVAEAALRKNTLATFTALNARGQKRSSLPEISNQTAAGPKCLICLDAVAEVMAYPCGHRCYCQTCADNAQRGFDEIAAQYGAPGSDRFRRCAVCRESVQDLVRVF